MSLFEWSCAIWLFMLDWVDLGVEAAGIGFVGLGVSVFCKFYKLYDDLSPFSRIGGSGLF